VRLAPPDPFLRPYRPEPRRDREVTMRRSVLPLLAALCLASFATPAFADAPLTDGVLCSLASVADPTAPAGTQFGVLDGGPVVMTEQDGTTPETGTLTCRIQVDVANHTGWGWAVWGHGTGVLTAGPSVVSYPTGSNVYLCAEFSDDSDGVTYYWDANASRWSTNASVSCGLAYGSDDPTEEAVLVDSIICPVLALAFPPEGDVTLRAPVGTVWDCPPYGNSNPPRRPVRLAYTVVAQ
jgi:hypothetical protein